MEKSKIVHYISFRYKFKVEPYNQEMIDEIYDWCEKEFGESTFGDDQRWQILGSTFGIRDEQDAMLFKLTWM